MPPKTKATEAPAGPFDPTKVVVVKALTSTFKWVEEKSYYFTVTGPMYLSDRTTEDTDAKGKKVKRDPPTMLPVLDLETQKKMEVIAAAVVKSTLEKYEDESYVGKTFHIIQHAKAPNKNYRSYTMEEIEVGG